MFCPSPGKKGETFLEKSETFRKRREAWLKRGETLRKKIETRGRSGDTRVKIRPQLWPSGPAAAQPGEPLGRSPSPSYWSRLPMRDRSLAQ